MTLGRGKRRKGLDSKVKLDLYRGKREFMKYLHGRSNEGARLLFKFRSGHMV